MTPEEAEEFWADDEPRPDYHAAVRSFVDQSKAVAAVERERDELRAIVARVKALADEWRDKRDQSIASAEARRGLHDENDLRFHAHIMSKRLRELGAALEGGDDE